MKNGHSAVSKRRHFEQGLTLIELMIVIVIVSILLAVAIPSYDESVRKSRRSEGMSLLASVIQQQERFFLNNMTYTEDLSELGYNNVSAGALLSENGFYQVTAAVCGASPIARCVELTATPQDTHADDGNLTLNSRGEKTATGKALEADVWR